MSTLIVKIDLQNAAFEDDPPGYEVARLLHNVASGAERNPWLTFADDFPLIDCNGNTVGSVTIEQD